MKTSRRIFWVLIAVVLAGYGAVSVCLFKDAGNMELAETVLQGNAQAVSDAAFTLPATYRGKLCWQSTVRPGGESAAWCRPNYLGTASYEEASAQSMVYPRVYLSFEQRGASSTSETSQIIWQNIFDDVTSRGGTGETYTESVRLADWFEYYPIEADVDLSRINDKAPDPQDRQTEKEIEQKLREYFCFPVDPEETVDVTITWDQDGKIAGQDVKNDGAFADLDGEFALVPGKCWFAPIAKDQNGQLLDYSKVPGGYGVYWLNAENKSAPRIEKKLDLDREEEILALCSDRSMKRVLVLTEQQNGECRLFVMDANTGEKLQTLDLGVLSFPSIETGEDWAVLVSYPEEEGEVTACFTLLLWQENGYQIRYTVKDEAHLSRQNYKINFQLAPDRERLAAAVQIPLTEEEESFASCGFLAAVYDENGPIYTARFANSLDLAQPAPGEHWESCYVDHTACPRPGDVPPMIHWDE